MKTFGLYEVLDLVAVGSTGTVYRAQHSELTRVAAIKELHPEMRDLPGLLERLRAEAQLLAELDNPHLVAIYDYVEDADSAWIAEEWVEGSSLEAILIAHRQLTPEQSLGVLRGALIGLASAHERGVVHRDIAPTNILADMAGTSKLVDFGLAAQVGRSGEWRRNTGVRQPRGGARRRGWQEQRRLLGSRRAVHPAVWPPAVPRQRCLGHVAQPHD